MNNTQKIIKSVIIMIIQLSMINWIRFVKPQAISLWLNILMIATSIFIVFVECVEIKIIKDNKDLEK